MLSANIPVNFGNSQIWRFVHLQEIKGYFAIRIHFSKKRSLLIFRSKKICPIFSGCNCPSSPFRGLAGTVKIRFYVEFGRLEEILKIGKLDNTAARSPENELCSKTNSLKFNIFDLQFF